MNDKQNFNLIFYDLWNLFKKYGFQQSLDEQEWNFFTSNGEMLWKKYKDMGAPFEQFYREMYQVIVRYYSGEMKFPPRDKKGDR